jgi:phage gp46-like protein
MDLALDISPDGADLVIDGDLKTDAGMAEAVFLSLFGGSADEREWWGNLLAENDEQKLVSRTQNLLRSLPITSANVTKIHDAVAADLQWITGETGFADELTIDVFIPEKNMCEIRIQCSVSDQVFEWKFRKGWGK